jgi:multisubunit Na+/H+ antiporter MnhG subunit
VRKISAWIVAHRIGLALAGLVLGGFALRVWGVSAVYQRIDDIPVARKIYAVYQGDWGPDPLLFYPIFFNYIVGILLKLGSAVLGLLGRNPSPGLYEFTFDQVLLIARLVSAAMGASTILVVFKIGKRLFSETTALAAAAFFSLSFIHILYSRQIVLDVPMTFFYAVAFYFCVRILKSGRWPHYLLAAFFAGIAVATKYNAMFVTASIVMAHLWKSRETQKNILKNLTDRKLVAAGAVTILSFFAGHPYALLWYKSFIRATLNLAALVHNTEWYLVLIKPQALLERLWESKYVKGLWNVMSAEGALLFILILLGLVWALRRPTREAPGARNAGGTSSRELRGGQAQEGRRTRETAFLAWSGLAYFLGALGFLGFSRLRDLSTLALFYALFAALGLALLGGIFGKGRGGRTAFAAFAVLVVAALGARSVGRVYYLAEDDTTQIAERWIRRNLPAGGVFGRELFTPEVTDPAYPALFFTRPYLIYGDFPAFSVFDYIERSSVQAGFFFQYAKYYPVQVGIYSRLNEERELLKDFFFRDIEYKNPEVRIYSGKFQRRPKQRLALPVAAAPDSLAREFIIADGSPYGKDVGSLWLDGGRPVERLLVSRTRIDRVAVFVRGAAGDGEVVVRSGLRRTAIPLRKGGDAFAVIEPSRAFPFYAYFYKVGLSASAGMPASFIKISADDFEIGLELVRSGEYVRAADFFRRAAAAPGPGVLVSEIPLYLAYCERMAGKAGADEDLRMRLAADPAIAARFAPFYAALRGGRAWERPFEKYAGISVPLFETTQTVLLEDDAFAYENAIAVESSSLANKKARKPSSDPAAGPCSGLSPELRLVPQAYRFELDFFDPAGAGGPIGKAEIVSMTDGVEKTAVFPIELPKPGNGRSSKCVLDFKPESFRTTVRLRLRLDRGAAAAFDRLRIVPDLKSFLLDRYGMFKDLLTVPHE